MAKSAPRQKKQLSRDGPPASGQSAQHRRYVTRGRALLLIAAGAGALVGQLAPPSSTLSGPGGTANTISPNQANSQAATAQTVAANHSEHAQPIDANSWETAATGNGPIKDYTLPQEQQVAKAVDAARTAAHGKKISGYTAGVSQPVPVLDTATSDAYANADATLTARVFEEPVNYQTSDGTWHAINPNLVAGSDGTFHNTGGPATVSLPASLGTGVDVAARAASGGPTQTVLDAAVVTTPVLAIVSQGGDALEVGVPTEGTQGAGGSLISPSSAASVSGKATSKDTGTYANVWPGTELEQVDGNDALSQLIVLSSPPTSNENLVFRFPLSATDVTATFGAGGEVEFVDSTGKVIFSLPSGVMSDSKSNSLSGGDAWAPLSYALGPGGSYVDVIASGSWLRDPSRAYPVTIDPSWTYGPFGGGTNAAYITNTVANGTFNYSWDTNLSPNDAITNVGFDPTAQSDSYWTLLSYPLPSQLQGATINSATWSGYFEWTSYCESTPYQVAPIASSWNASNVTWNSQPSLSRGQAQTGYVDAHQGCVSTPSQSSVNATAWVQAWASGAAPEDGIALYESSANGGVNWLRMASNWTVYGSADVATLTITYSGINLTSPTSGVSLTGTESGSDVFTPMTATPVAATPSAGTGTWASIDVGSPSPAGSSTQSNGVFTVNGSGADIWGSSDQFHYVYQPLDGDGSITAQVESQTNPSGDGGWAKAGVIIKQSTTAGSAYALMAVTPSNGFRFEYGFNTTVGGGSYTFPNAWVRLTRTGSTVTGYASTNGSTWSAVGSTTVSLTDPVTVGLAVTAHDAGSLSAATFANVSISSPDSSWGSTDVGGPSPAGSSNEVNGVFTVSGSGADIWGSSDQFHYVFQPLVGNGSITAQVTSQTNPSGDGGWAKAGVIIKQSTTAGSAYALMAVTPSNGFQFEYGFNTTVGGGSYTFPNAWVRLTRTGSTVTGYASTNGSTWSAVGSTTVSLTDPVTVGLAVTAHDAGSLSTATFQNVSVTANPSAAADGNIVGPNGMVALPIGGQLGIPVDAAAVAVNVTAMDPTAGGYLDVFPTGSSILAASSEVNFGAGQAVSNLVDVPLGSQGQVSVGNYSSGSTDVVVTVEGYFAPPVPGSTAGAGLTTVLQPGERICDTRSGSSPYCQGYGALGGSATMTVQVTGNGGVPASGVAAVVINLTALPLSGEGAVVAYPAGASTVPGASSLEWGLPSLAYVANEAIVPLSASGQMSITNIASGSANLLVDVTAWISSGTQAARLGRPSTRWRSPGCVTPGPVAAHGPLTTCAVEARSPRVGARRLTWQAWPVWLGRGISRQSRSTSPS